MTDGPASGSGPSEAEREAHDELQAYTLAHDGSTFIHQHVVDAWAAQSAEPDGKPIALTFALVGLYLHLEQGFTGRQVQRAHMTMARRPRDWPRFALPADRGAVTCRDVMARPAGPARDEAIDAWCASVWAAYHDSRDAVVRLVAEYGVA